MNVSQSTFLNLGVLLDLGYKIIYLRVENRFIRGYFLIYLGVQTNLFGGPDKFI